MHKQTYVCTYTYTYPHINTYIMYAYGMNMYKLHSVSSLRRKKNSLDPPLFFKRLNSALNIMFFKNNSHNDNPHRNNSYPAR